MHWSSSFAFHFSFASVVIFDFIGLDDLENFNKLCGTT